MRVSTSSPVRPRVLVLSRNYPSAAIPMLGIWVHRLVEVVRPIADQDVVAPVPWVPPLVPLPRDFGRFREVPDREESPADVAVHHPRVPLPPGSRFQAWEERLALPAIRSTAMELHRARPFDLIHAHFAYPDGVIAARLGRELGVPVMITEHARWIPWMKDRPATWDRVRAVLDSVSLVTGVSEAVRSDVETLTDGRVATDTLPVVLDDRVFRPAEGSPGPDPDTLLFVGVIRAVKGFDVLVRALARLAEHRPGISLAVVGEPFYRSYRTDFERAMTLAERLGVAERIHILGGLPPEGVAESMRDAALLVVPSRRESFSSVTVEALACGTPVVATRCGGPEEILNEDVGVLVETEDERALADGIEAVLSGRRRFDPAALREYAVGRYGRDASRRRVAELYARVAPDATFAGL